MAGRSATFSWRRRMNGERMDAALEFIRQQFIHHAMALDAALPLEGFRYDIHVEVGLSARPVPGVSLMTVRFVGHIEAPRRERPLQLIRNDVARAHDTRYGWAVWRP